MAIKRPAKKAAKKVVKKSSTPKKKVIARAVKKSASRKPAKKVTKKSAASTGGGVAGQNLPREYNEQGFVIGSNSEIIANILLEGGVDRPAVNKDLFKALKGKVSVDDATLRRNIPSMVSAVLSKLTDQGYTVDSSWVVLPPVAGAKVKRKASKKAAPAKAKAAPVKKAPAKKVASKRPAKKKAPVKRRK